MRACMWSPRRWVIFIKRCANKAPGYLFSIPWSCFLGSNQIRTSAEKISGQVQRIIKFLCTVNCVMKQAESSNNKIRKRILWWTHGRSLQWLKASMYRNVQWKNSGCAHYICEWSGCAGFIAWKSILSPHLFQFFSSTTSAAVLRSICSSYVAALFGLINSEPNAIAKIVHPCATTLALIQYCELAEFFWVNELRPPL